MSDRTTQSLLEITVRIVEAYLVNNVVDASALPPLIRSVYRTLSSVDKPESELGSAAVQQSAAPMKKSVFPDYIICLEDGLKLKMLRRHLMNSYGMTPDDYRTKWGLPRDYPMVSPAYAAIRSDIAKQSGLGRKFAVEPAVTRLPARRARGAKG